jgi:EAL domain-containing protein (putative c-di-GMP-specific phosphodiesterase class I)
MAFIPVAEETGLILPIGRWVLSRACDQGKAWQDKGFAPVPIGVNITARQLGQADFYDMVTGILESASDVLNQLNGAGIRLAIDDFGSGYSSLARLKTLPITSLKIDNFFINNVLDDERDAAIVKAIISLARSLEIQVVAEGVETSEQLEFLMALNREQHKEGKVFEHSFNDSDETLILE